MRRTLSCPSTHVCSLLMHTSTAPAPSPPPPQKRFGRRSTVGLMFHLSAQGSPHGGLGLHRPLEHLSARGHQTHSRRQRRGALAKCTLGETMSGV